MVPANSRRTVELVELYAKEDRSGGSDEERAASFQAVLAVLTPLIEQDGGTLHGRIDPQARHARITLSGACGSCALSGATLEEGVERILPERLPWLDTIETSVERTDAVGQGRWRAL